MSLVGSAQLEQNGGDPGCSTGALFLAQGHQFQNFARSAELKESTPHSLQSNSCRAETAFKADCVHCMRRPQNGQCGRGVSGSMPLSLRLDG